MITIGLNIQEYPEGCEELVALFLSIMNESPEFKSRLTNFLAELAQLDEFTELFSGIEAKIQKEK